ncbi:MULTISPECIES: hypothetical protein [Streptomyces]|uniref:Uncharacterized protein n=1 Tax=Streptomyces lasalocidi TaxID=324833 RepID=A0A4U5W6J7_STRLS|nr:hypothetical protein [Streptomyces lasalocidi]TKS96220.1 hypothetical protein E4U91_36490 [Streptomyces lasalocidi]
MEITTDVRSSGVYVIGTVGMHRWTNSDGTWRAHGVHLALMDGPQRLAVCALEIAGTLAAEELGAAQAEAIEPWAATVRCLAIAAQLRQSLDTARGLLTKAELARGCGDPVDEGIAQELFTMATASELEEAGSGSDYKLAPLAQLIAHRLERLVGAELRKALALAPDPGRAPVHSAWALPGWPGTPRASLVQTLARGLLEGWADVRDLRDPLVTWAVHDAGLTRTEVQQTTSVSRTTINRLLER